MGIKVAKFGGSSLADANQFRKVKNIILADADRKFVVPSAPGKRFSEDIKITDMLYQCYALVEKGKDHAEIFEKIAARYIDIAEQLQLDFDIRALLEKVYTDIGRAKSPDFSASRGEYINGVILANYLGWDFIDAKDVIKFDRQGNFAAEWTNDVLSEELRKHEHAVIPGFYGAFPNGEVRTFSRGGSDISGSIVARAAGADLYENWTDVCGFLMADPRIVKDPCSIKQLTYRELRELSYMGATVLHEEAMFPVHKAGIPTNIRNTNQPEHPGTMIVANPGEKNSGAAITGIAGQKDFTLISIEKSMMNSEMGFGRRVLQALEDFGVSFEHMPSSIDSICVVVADKELQHRQDRIIERIREYCDPDSIEVVSGLAMVATVGHGMVRNCGTAAKLFKSLYEAGVNVRMIDQGSSELNIIVGIDATDFETAINAIYNEFMTEKV